jgi:predicted MFS family arabinose efflux permease
LDRVGFPVLIIAFFLSALFAPFVFLGSFWPALFGMMLWGVGLGAQDSLLKALLAGVVSAGKRSTAFGLFDTAFGVAWFLGSAALGLLYDRSVPALIALSVTLQLLSLPMFLRGRARAKAVGR